MGPRRDGRGDFTELVNHHDKGARYTSICHGQALAQAGIADSVGSTGDSYDCQSVLTGSMLDPGVPAATV